MAKRDDLFLRVAVAARDTWTSVPPERPEDRISPRWKGQDWRSIALQTVVMLTAGGELTDEQMTRALAMSVDDLAGAFYRTWHEGADGPLIVIDRGMQLAEEWIKGVQALLAHVRGELAKADNGAHAAAARREMAEAG